MKEARIRLVVHEDGDAAVSPTLVDVTVRVPLHGNEDPADQEANVQRAAGRMITEAFRRMESEKPR